MNLVKSKRRVTDYGEVFTPEKTYPPTTISELGGMYGDAPKEADS